MKKIYTINGKQYQVSDKEQVINGGYYLIKKGDYFANDTVCQFKHYLFFYETEDGTKWANPREMPYNTKVFLLEMI